MSELNDEMSGAAEERPSETSAWIERLTETTSDFESISAENAAGLGL